LQSQFSYSVLPGTWKLPCFLKIKIFSVKQVSFRVFLYATQTDKQASFLFRQENSVTHTQGQTQCHTTWKYTKCRIRLTIASQFPFLTGTLEKLQDCVNFVWTHTQID
jgi:hypothetical protein